MRAMCCLLLLIAVQARAELVQHGTYVRDTATGLEWMNSSLTLGYTYHSALADSQGWRHATRREIDALAKRYINSPEGAYMGGQDFTQTLRVIALFGATFESLGDQSGPVKFAVMGYYNDGSLDGGVGLADFSVSLFVPMDPSDPVYPDLFVSRWVTMDNFLPPETRSNAIANFLVRRRTP
jgi:hypothetical protein